MFVFLLALALSAAVRLNDHVLATLTVVASVMALFAALVAIALADQTVSESRAAGKTLQVAAASLNSAAELLDDILRSAAAARREDHLRSRVAHLRELNDAFILRMHGAREAIQWAGPSNRWVDGEIRMTIALAAFPKDELVETRRAMNISSPGEFMQAVPGVTDELHVALTSANTELVGLVEGHTALLAKESEEDEPG
jgi:hypothetical protein